MADEVGKDSAFEAAQAVWSRRKWLGILAFAAPFSVAASSVMALPSLYTSTVTLVVERQQVPEELVKSTVTGLFDTRLQTISQEILSRSRLEGLISRFGLYGNLRKQASMDEVIDRMRKDIQLEPKFDLQQGMQRVRPSLTIGFAIRYRGLDPPTVAQVANTIASFYIEENLKVRERQAVGTSEFLRTQVEDVKKRLDEQERRITEFKKRFMGALPEQKQANLSTLERLNTQLRLNSDNQVRALERRETLRRQLGEAGGLAGPAGGSDATAVRIARLRQELTELRTRFSEKYPDVVRVKTEIAALERELAEGKSDGKPGGSDAFVVADPYVRKLRDAVNEVEAELKVLKAEETHTRQAIARYQQRVEETPQREGQLLDLSRDYESTRNLYTSLLRRYDEAQLSESMEQRQKGEQFRIVDPAVPAQGPAAPNRALLMVAGLLVSIGLAIGAVLFAEQVDTSFHSAEDLRRFSAVPVLLSIPKVLTEGDARRQRRRFWLAAVSSVLALSLLVGVAYFVAHGNEYLVGVFAGKAF